MYLITESLLNEVSAQAEQSPRLRMNYNFHESPDAPVQRMLNALEPGTYLPPHRHANPDREEMYIVLRGRLLTLFFDEDGQVTERVELAPSEGRYGIEIPAGVWHSIIVLEKGTVIYEAKQGPYIPLSKDNLAPWAPEATDKEAVADYMEQFLQNK